MRAVGMREEDSVDICEFSFMNTIAAILIHPIKL